MEIGMLDFKDSFFLNACRRRWLGCVTGCFDLRSTFKRTRHIPEEIFQKPKPQKSQNKKGTLMKNKQLLYSLADRKIMCLNLAHWVKLCII
ncbi:MAG TPA: hypothetical protein DER04_02170 [Holosporales bacterium]|nr:MAG: hypothetical protein A2W62_04885 [Alphaproteobacteria bacterium RIFCSPLOWO2_02_42_7]OFX05012.1 MAG: hypothetical protein A3H46_01325 [Alphaproteobacteria bacterium RIFCSPLOWO2_02_FULL_43_54]OFX07629.1 MAG: hypothetical protein A3G78_07810 [Alphaproteobacteria bacterium RIFCSPLOWO2_12_FULL_42_29]HCE95559.1 hypothetical protein [Holosporales bacterium]